MLRNSWLLALFALVALSAAFDLEGLHIDGIEEYVVGLQKRQASGTGNSPTPNPPTSTPAPPTSSPRNTPTTPPASPTPDSTPSPTPGTSNGPAPSTPTSRGQSTPTQRSSTVPTSAPATSVPRNSPIISTSDLVSTSLQRFTVTYTTESNGAQIEVTSTGTSSIPITTGQATVTLPPVNQEGGDNGGGLSDSNKKVIGGVVGGIGGALLLGGIALVFWRMKRRQHKVTAEDDDLNLNTGAALGDKSHNGTGPSPFQSNLEQYHNPGGRPNAASNF